MAHRPMPGSMQHHMGMMPPGPMMPQRIGTPPTVPSMPMGRSHTPSPEPVLPVASSAGDVKEGEAETKRTNVQQRTQTVPKQGTQTVSTKKKPSSRPSSRRNSEDKTEQPPREKKKEEVKVDKETANKETTNKETPRGNQTPEPQRQRQGTEQALNQSV